MAEVKRLYNQKRQRIIKTNPCVGLTDELHDAVTQAQREAGLLDPDQLANMDLYDIVTANLDILTEVGVPESVLDALKRMITRFIYINNIY